MAIGVAPDMRRMAAISVVGHLLILLALTAVPYVKAPMRDMGSYQVLLISPSKLLAPMRPQEMTTPAPPPAQKQTPVSIKHTLPAPPVEKIPAREASKTITRMPPIPAERHLTKSTKTPQAAQSPHAIPRLGEFRRPDLPMDETPPGPSPIQVPRQEAPTPPAADKDLLEALKKAEDNLNKTPAALAPALPSATVTTKRSRTSEEINRELSELSVPKAMKSLPPTTHDTPAPVPQPSIREEVNRMLAETRAASQESTMPKREPVREMTAAASVGASRAATLERCPAKAQRYCPVLEAAINRMWNADYSPSVRQVLESSGNSAALILIEIRPDGMIQNITLQESSGNKNYDLAIQGLLRDQRRFPPLPDELKGENFKAITSFKYTRKT